MPNLKNDFWMPKFSHLYIEGETLKYPETHRILKYFQKAKVVEINHYKDVFCRGNQHFILQKKSPKLILAVKKDNFLYKGAEVCEDFGNKYFYYTSCVMNCIYDCHYCYLQGMYPSANIVIFVNIEDYFTEVEKLLKKHPVYLCISYDTDLLAIEGITSYVSKWFYFAQYHSELTIEVRTKSANFKAIKDFNPLPNIILAWTLSPEKVINLYENGTPSLDLRLKNIQEAVNLGWKVRLCFDPILYLNDWQGQYGDLIDKTFNQVPPEQIHDVSLGVFRVSKEYLKKMQKGRPDSPLLAYPFIIDKGVCSYSSEHSQELIKYIYNRLNRYIPKNKIYI